MKKVMIPTCMFPFVVEVNGKRYTYPAGTEQEVPDDVAIIIEAHNNRHEEQPSPVEQPFTIGGGIEVTGAEVGQTIVVKAVDENGKPTEWMPADIANEKWELIVDITIEEEVAQVDIRKDINGEKFELRKSHVVVRTEATASNTSDKSASMRVGIDSASYEVGMNIPKAFRANATNGFSATFESTGFSNQGFARSSAGLAYGYNRIISEDNISANPNFPVWCTFFRIYGGTFAIGSRIRIWGVRA